MIGKSALLNYCSYRADLGKLLIKTQLRHFHTSVPFWKNKIARDITVLKIHQNVTVRTRTEIINIKSYLDMIKVSETQSVNVMRSRKYTLILFGGSTSFLALYLLFELAKPATEQNCHIRTVTQYICWIMNKLDDYKRLIKEHFREKLLPDPVKHPQYQPRYTLVLELTDVLVYHDWTHKTGWHYKKRPGIDQFLESVSGLFEIVIFTAEQGMTVFPIIEALDPKNLIAYKLGREATHLVDGHHVKNLDKLNRNLANVIVVDWNLESVKFQPDNVFHIHRWNGNNDDTALIDLAAFLKAVARSEIADVREVLRYYSDFDDPLMTFRNKQKELHVSKIQADSPIKRWARNLFGISF